MAVDAFIKAHVECRRGSGMPAESLAPHTEAGCSCCSRKKSAQVERRREHESNSNVETKRARRGDVCAGWRVEYFGHGKGTDTGDARRDQRGNRTAVLQGVGEEGLGADRRSTGRELHFYQREQRRS